MKLAIMQPYFFPYIGYFQLMNAVDLFVLYDDVAFISKGWINRNRILVNRQPYLFTIPLKNASQNVLIKDLQLAVNDKWKNKFLKTIELAYKKAPFFDTVYDIVKEVVKTQAIFLKDWHLKSFELVKIFLDINTPVTEASKEYKNRSLKGQERILDICIKEHAEYYINPVGGEKLYNKQSFSQHELTLRFFKSREIYYQQFKNEFVPWLSMIDVMMFNSTVTIQQFFGEYDLI